MTTPCTCCASCKLFSDQDRQLLQRIKLRLKTLATGIYHCGMAVPNQGTRAIMLKYSKLVTEMFEEIK